jgi:hypothetical protein
MRIVQRKRRPTSNVDSMMVNDLHRKGKVEKVGRGRMMRWKLVGNH